MIYFGRCLGAVAVALSGGALGASRKPSERRQPPIEHAEIAGYAAFAVAARRFRP